MFKKYADALWGVVILIVCALMFYATTQIRVFAAMEGLSSRFFPRVIIAIMAILGLFLIYFDLKRAKGYTQPEEDSQKKKGISVGDQCVLETMVALLAYVALLDPIGFIPTTIVYLIVQMTILSSKPSKKDLLLFALIAVVSSVGIYFLFTKAFYLMLPAGILG